MITARTRTTKTRDFMACLPQTAVCDIMRQIAPDGRPSSGRIQAGEDFAWRRELTGRLFLGCLERSQLSALLFLHDSLDWQWRGVPDADGVVRGSGDQTASVR